MSIENQQVLSHSEFPVKKRNVSLDWIRVLAMFWIIYIFHLKGYLSSSLFVGNLTIESLITSTVLGVFFFISGYLLGKRNTFTTLKEVGIFYKKRLLRIFPLFGLSVITFPSYTNWSERLQILLCVAPNAKTLWFVGIIVWFYFLTPIVLWKVSVKSFFPRMIIAIVLLNVIIYALTGSIIFRYSLYFPYYLSGIFCAIREFDPDPWKLTKKIFTRKLSTKELSTLGYLLLEVIVIGAMYFLLYKTIAPDNRSLAPFLVICSFGIVAFLFVGYCPLLRNQKLERVVTFLAYSSFAMYLFHRQVYYVAELISQKCTTSTTGQYTLFLILGIPGVIAVAYILQRLNDRFFDRINESSKKQIHFRK